MKRARNIQSCFGWAKNSEKKHHYSLPMHAPQTSDGRTHTVAGVVENKIKTNFNSELRLLAKSIFSKILWNIFTSDCYLKLPCIQKNGTPNDVYEQHYRGFFYHNIQIGS